jgi:TP901 family phage tail tape measure protein
MAGKGTDIGYATLPVILSLEGIDGQVKNKLSKTFGDVGKKAGKALADGSAEEVNKLAAAYGKLRDKAEDALGKVRVEEEKLAKARAGGKTDQIVAAEERLNKARRDSASANRAAAASYKDVEDAQKRLGDSSRDAGLSFGNLGDMAGKAGSAMAAAGVVAAGAALAGIAALGGGVIILGRELYELGKSWDDTMDGIAIKTGIIGPELDKLNSSLKAMAPSTAASIGAIGDVMGSVSQSLHLTGIELDLMTKQIVDLNRMTETTTNVRELAMAFRGFGVEAKDQRAALDSIAGMSRVTGISVNDLVKTMAESGYKLRDFGLSFAETATLMATMESVGVPAQKAVDALGKAALNLAKDGKGGMDGLRSSLREIQNLLNTGQTDLARANAATLFGAKAYGPIFDALRRGALDIDNLDKALANTQPTIAQLADATDDWDQSWQKLKNTVSVALEPIASGVFNLINKQLEGLSEWVTQNQSTVIGFFSKIAEWAFNSAKAVVGFVADSMRALATMIEKLGPVISGIGDALDWIPGMDNAAESLKDLGKSMDSIPGTIRGAADSFEGKLLPALQKGQDYTAAFIERTKSAARFTEVLGDTIADINANGDIQLSDNTPEVAERLKTIGITVVELPDGTIGVTADTDEAEQILKSFRDQSTGKPIDLKIGADTSAAKSKLEELRRQFFEAFNVPVPANLPAIGGAALGGGVPGPPGATGSEKGLTPTTIGAKRAIEQNFPAIKNIGGWRPPDGFNEHFNGQALDVMIPDWGSSSGKAYGDSVVKYLLDNSAQTGVDYVLWQQRQWNADGTSSAMSDRGDPTQNHMDHVHVHTVGTPQLPGATAPKLSPSTTTVGSGGGARAGVPVTPAAAGASPALDMTRLQAAPGSRAGVNELGEAGTYEVDPKRYREAQQRVGDADENIKAADAAAEQARARLAEMPIDAEESAILGATESVRAAEARAEKARREAADAATDLAETAKGEFKKAGKAAKESGGGSDVSGIGGIFGSFLKETLGIDISNLMPLQMLGTAFEVGGAMSQSLAEHASAAPFGIPEIAAPPMPEGGAHGGLGGLPGPGTIVNVDNSQHLEGANLGWDPAQVEKQRNNNINRSPRLPVGVG